MGSAVYAAGIDEKVKEFIKSIDVNVGEVVNFSSAALIESTYKQVKKEVEAKGLKMSEKEFHCRGAFKFVHRGRPNDEDLRNAQEFAKETISWVTHTMGMFVELEDNSYFKDLVESVKTYLIEYPKKKNFPKNVYDQCYDVRVKYLLTPTSCY